jgi:Protein of unknown function (DUF3180)
VKPTRPLTLLVIVIVCAAITWAILDTASISLPALPWSMSLALLLLAGAEAWSGRDLRARIRKRNSAKPVPHPSYTTRMLALAKSTSLAGSLIGGIAAGFALFTSGSTYITAYRQDLIAGSAIFASCLILIAAALYLENSIRVPDDES